MTVPVIQLVMLCRLCGHGADYHSDWRKPCSIEVCSGCRREAEAK